MPTTHHSSQHPSVGPTSRVLARDLASRPEGAPATLAGWVHRRRVLASVTFVVLRDRSGLVQVIVKDPDVVARLGAIPEETVVEVTGRVAHNETAPGGAELVEPVFTPLTEPAEPPPAELWRPTFGAGLPTVGISNLAAVAQQVARPGDNVLVCMDARMNEVYWGLFACDAATGLVSALSNERVDAPERVSAGESAATIGAGTGFTAYPLLARNFPATIQKRTERFGAIRIREQRVGRDDRSPFVEER